MELFGESWKVYSPSVILSQYFDRCQGDLTPTQQKIPTTFRRDRGFVLGRLWKKSGASDSAFNLSTNAAFGYFLHLFCITLLANNTYVARGSHCKNTLNVLPTPGLLSTSIRPPIFFIRF